MIFILNNKVIFKENFDFFFHKRLYFVTKLNISCLITKVVIINSRLRKFTYLKRLFSAF